MKNYRCAMRTVTACLCIFLHATLKAQLITYQPLDLTAPPPEFSSDVVQSNALSVQWLCSLNASDASQVPNYASFRESLNNVRNAYNAIPVSICDYRYSTLDDDAQSNIISRSVWLYLDVQWASAGTHHFVYDPSLFYTNTSGENAQVQIDFDDGLGLRQMPAGNIVVVEYSSAAERNLKFVLTRGDDVISGSYRMSGNACSSTFPDPSPNVPWATNITSNCSDCYWRIATSTPSGNEVSGNAYYLPEGSFDKPFIFVEGIDFAYNNSATQNGDFGWCQFTSGNSDPDYKYNFLYGVRTLLEEARHQGYDIILLDFADGAGAIEDNAALLEHLIRMVNATKEGDESIVLAGASMGALVSRYALSEMEHNEEPHCTGLWISLDGPHQGAYIPIGLQQLIYALNNEGAAQAFINDKLNRPAARQLMRMQYRTESSEEEIYSPGAFNDLYTRLNDWGLPKNCRNIAISNGSLNGTKLWNNAFDPVMAENCELSSCSSGPEARFMMTGSNGDPWYNDWWGNASNETHNVSAQLVRSQAPQGWVVTLSTLLGGIGGYITSNACLIDKNIRTFYVPKNLPNYDYSSGGTRGSMEEFAEAINSVGQLQSNGCNPLENYHRDHCFIPTASALGIQNANPEWSVASILENDASQCPFDAYFGPENYNEEHSSVNNQNLPFILENVLGRHLTPGVPANHSVENPLGIYFNFGKPGYNVLEHTFIHSGGRVGINQQQLLHYGEEPVMPAVGSHFKTYILGDCSGLPVRIGAMGVLNVGDPQGLSTADLIIRGKGVLEIFEGGRLNVHSGSKIIVDDGGTLIIHDGAFVNVFGEDELNTQIELKKGGHIICHKSRILLNGSNSELMLRGGTLEVVSGKRLLIQSDIYATGAVVVASNDHITQLNEDGLIEFQGQNGEDAILKIYDHVQWQPQGVAYHVFLSNCAAYLSNASEANLKDELRMLNVTVNSDENDPTHGRISHHDGKARFSNCRFNRSPLYGENTSFQILQCRFNTAASGVKISSTRYSCIESNFDNCGIRSEASGSSNEVIDCSFMASGPDQWNVDFIIEEGNGNLSVTKSIFTSANTAITKSRGMLQLGCTRIERSMRGLFIHSYASLDMSTDHNFGKNVFRWNEVHIETWLAQMLDLTNGFNTLTNYGLYALKGSMNINCGNNCSPVNMHISRNNVPVSTLPSGMLGSTTSGLLTGTLMYTELVSETCSELEGSNCLIRIIDLNPSQQENTCNDEPSQALGHAIPRSALLSEHDTDVKLYPNPNEGRCTIEADYAFGGVEVYTPSGKMYWSASFADVNRYELVLPSETAPGYYIVRLKGTQQSDNYTLIVFPSQP